MRLRAERLLLSWLESPTPFLFFTGKGGVGKTSLACATSLELARRGKRVLLVSTDPASNLDQVFGLTVGTRAPVPVPGVEGLEVLNIDPESAAQAYRDRIVGPVRGVLPEPTVSSIEEQLSGACTTEIAAFDEFTSLLTSPPAVEHIVFDTAPTGHTLRLLSLPGAWSGFLETSQSGASCLGPLAGLEKQRAHYSEAVARLADARRSTLVLVSRPDASALEEAARTSRELAHLGLTNQRLVVNAAMTGADPSDPLAAALMRRQQTALEAMPEALRALALDTVPMQPFNLVGLANLQSLLRPEAAPPAPAPRPLALPEGVSSLRSLVDLLEGKGHGLVLVMGKGGVGKTTTAAAVAVALAARGHEVHLTTTDPAAHVQATLQGAVDNLEVSRIDPRVETERYRNHVLATRGKDLDEHGRALLEEDLRSPCTEEIAVFQAFSQAISEAHRKFVVIDTAPTGHTLLLIDATGAYHRDVMRHVQGMTVRTPLMRLQDPKLTSVLIVTLAETTPVHEAARLQEDLRRAGIEPWAWVINSSLAAAHPHDPLLVARAESELAEIERVKNGLADRVALVPCLAEKPVGRRALLELTEASVPTRG